MAFLNENGLALLWNQILARLNNFVPFEAGKGLSTNDYTNEEKEKLNNIDEGANNYILPVGDSVIGGVKNGGGIKIDSAGKMNISDGAVTRAKLANDALYSPVKVINSPEYVISADDIGKTLFVSISGDVSIALNKEIADALPVGTEIAVCAFTTPNVTITLNGVRVCIFDEAVKGSVNGSVSLAVQIPHGMVALKKVYKQITYGDLWFVTGNVEVVS